MPALLLLLDLGCAPRNSGADPLAGWTREEGTSSYGPVTTWCRVPDPVIGCSDRRIRPGSGWRVREPGRWEAADFPADGWGGQLGISGDDWTLLLVRMVGGVETDRFTLGRALGLTIEITDVAAKGGPFAGYDDPGTIGDTVCGQLATLYDVARAQLDAREVQRCHYGHYSGDSSIACTPVPLPASEAADWRRSLGDEERRHCDQARTDAAELARLVRGLSPRE